MNAEIAKHKDKLVVSVIVVLTAALSIVSTVGYQSYRNRQPHFMSDIARKYDPAHVGQNDYITIQMSCFTTRQVYAYANFNVDLKTGKMYPIKMELPPDGFKCPETAPLPGRGR